MEAQCKLNNSQKKYYFLAFQIMFLILYLDENFICFIQAFDFEMEQKLLMTQR